MENVKEIIIKNKAIAVIRGVYGEQLDGLLTALWRGGVRVAEITFGDISDSETCEVVSETVKKFEGKLLLGAGTVTSEECAYYALKAGAKFVVAPDTDAEVIEYVKQRGGFFIAGALTPTEVKRATVSGADMVKIFPSSTVGTKYFSDLKGPFPHIDLVAFGGITRANFADYIRAGAKGAGIGGDLVRKDLIKSGEFGEIEKIAREYAEIARG